MGPLYQTIRRARWNCRRLKAAHTRSHPEEGERAYSTFNSKESRILATDAYAERKTMQDTEEAINNAMNKGLKFNVRVEPEDVLYVTAEEILKGLYEPGKFYRKQEGGPMRVHNIVYL
jgi:hypothetical protein